MQGEEEEVCFFILGYFAVNVESAQNPHKTYLYSEHMHSDSFENEQLHPVLN